MKTHGNSRKLQKTQFPQFSPVFRSFPQFSPVFPSFSQFFPVFPSFPQFLWPLKPQFSYARAEKITVHQIDKKKRIKNISSISPKFNFLQFCPVLPSFAQFFPVFPSFSPNIYHLIISISSRARRKNNGTPAAIITLFFPALLLSRATSNPDWENFRKLPKTKRRRCAHWWE